MKRIEITIKPQRRKSLMMRVAASGEVMVHIPNWMHPRDSVVQDFIAKALDKLKDKIPEKRAEPRHTEAAVCQMIEMWAARMEVSPGRVQFRTMSRKWGSCSGKGNITLNTSLFYLPTHLVEYVVVHELLHLRIFNHNTEFWAKLAEYIPECCAYEQELDRYWM